MRLHHLAALAGLAGALLLAGGQPQATGNLEVITQSGTAIGNRVWHANSIPIVWQYNDPTTVGTCSYSSTNAPAMTLLPALQAAYDAWEVDPDSALDFTYGGTTATRNVGNDGVNVVTFCDSVVLQSNQGFLASTPSTALASQITVTAGGGCPAGQGILDANGPQPPAGFCFPVGTYPAGTTIDADIRFNTFGTFEQANFSTNNTIGTSDVQAVMTHEIGHFFGLSHDPIPQAVMFPFVDDEPASDGMGQRVLKRSDLSTAGHFYPAASFGVNFGSITGFISLDGVDADGVHVAAIDPSTMLGVSGRFAISRFEDSLALGPDGPDFAANGAGFYRIDGLPPGDYYVYVEYFDNSDFISGRLVNRYNTTVGNSNVSNGNSGSTGQVGSWLGFIPALAEFHNAGDSGHGGNGIDPGTALDNSDVATLVPVTAGTVTSNVNIAINIEPVNGQTAVNRQNPTTRNTLPNDLLGTNDIITAFLLEEGDDDWWAIRFPASALPPVPFNVAEGQWMKAGLSTMPMVTRLAFADPNSPSNPALNDPVVASAGRVLTGGPGGTLPAGDFIDVRDQWNVTVTQAQDVWILINQPESDPNITFLTEGFFALVAQTQGGAARVNNTRLTINGGASWSTFTQGDVFYDLILEADPPVMITGASPASMNALQTADVDINGLGFQMGAAVDFGPFVTVNNVTFMSPQQLRANITVAAVPGTAPVAVNVKVTNPDVVFPNVARVFSLVPVQDTDLDGTPDTEDCAPGDSSIQHPATEVANLLVADLGGSTQLTWDSQDMASGTATVYDVVTGIAGDLRTTPGYGMAQCGADNHADSPFVDMNPDPPLDGIRYWLVRAFNGCTAGSGTYGDSNVAPDPRDALDAGVPCP
ncbi:MAG TPA: matrixin family metalloprotease [Candidatus Polarisedimenticolia bacterium]|nr:matrixin family metalloprotease [Candidatus Polarisedimenticolia bacterium]